MIGITNGNGGSAGAANNVVRKNLLDNWYFGKMPPASLSSGYVGSQPYRYPINQRNNGRYSADINSYVNCFDRWMINNGVVEDDPDGIVIIGNSSQDAGSTSFDQMLNVFPEIMQLITASSITLTFSVMTDSTHLYTETVEYDGTSSAGILGDGWSFRIIAESPVVEFLVEPGDESNILIYALKVEIGDTQTLAHQENGVWVLNELPDYQEELVKCKTSMADPFDPYANQENLVGFQTRPNLIDNWYFAGGGSQQGEGYLPINQRGQTSYSGAIAYTIDRWRTSNTNTTITVSAAGLTFSAVTGTTPYLLQPLGNIEKLRGKTVTASFLIGNQLYSKTDVFPVNDPSDVSAICGISQVGQILYMSGAWYMRLIGSLASFNPYIAVKFEVGNSQTLAHWDSVNGAWVLNEVPDYQEQLFRCQTANADVTGDNYANKENLVGFQVKPNLLDNWYFVGGGSQQGGGQFPINQRGSTSYSGAVYMIDRWVGLGAQTRLDLTSGGVKLYRDSTSDSGRLTQRLDPGILSSLEGQKVTLSILFDSLPTTTSNALLMLWNNTTIGQVNIEPSSPKLMSVTITVPTSGYSTADASYQRVQFTTNALSANAGVIKAMKLEIGSTQTLAHQENGVWVLNEIPNYEEQLYRCKMSTADSSDTYANNNRGYLPITGGTLTGLLYTNGGITMPTGFTSNGQGTVDLTANTYTAGANGHVLAAKFKSEDGSQTHTTYPISIIGNSNTTNNYNSGVRLGSINGTTIVSAGESGSTFATANAKFDDENLYLVADGQVLLYKAANDGTVSLGPLVVAGFGATPTSGQVVVTSGTAGDIRSSGYAVNSSGGIPSYQYSTTDLTAGTSSLTTGRLYFVYE